MDKINESELLLFLEFELTKICGFAVVSDTSLLRSGILDSLGLMEIIVSVQNQFHIQVEIESLSREVFDTPKMMAKYFIEHKQ